MHFYFLFLLALFSFSCSAQPISQPLQPQFGLGSSDYVHASVEMHDFAEEPDGYWLFTPSEPMAKKADLIVFLHGYGGYNPMIYGKWIKHLVKQGNVVLYPRYQQNLAKPKPRHFGKNVAQAIQDGLKELRKLKYPKLDRKAELIIIGHSYGGVIASDLAINYENYEIPKPSALMLCSSGTGFLKEGRLDSYAAMPSDTKVVIISSENDYVVGDEISVRIFNEAKAVENMTYLRQYPDAHGEPALYAGHNLTYSVDLDFDAKMMNHTARKALRVSTLDPMDYNGYWKLFDALIACERNDEHCDICFGDNPAQTSLGNWSDGTPIKPLVKVARKAKQ